MKRRDFFRKVGIGAAIASIFPSLLRGEKKQEIINGGIKLPPDIVDPKMPPPYIYMERHIIPNPPLHHIDESVRINMAKKEALANIMLSLYDYDLDNVMKALHIEEALMSGISGGRGEVYVLCRLDGRKIDEGYYEKTRLSK